MRGIWHPPAADAFYVYGEPGFFPVVRATKMTDEQIVTDAEYLYRRAEQELLQAQRAEHPAVVKAHYMLAGYYLDLVYGPGDEEKAAAE